MVHSDGTVTEHVTPIIDRDIFEGEGNEPPETPIMPTTAAIEGQETGEPGSEPGNQPGPRSAEKLILPLYQVPIEALQDEQPLQGINRLDQILRKAERGAELSAQEAGEAMFLHGLGVQRGELERQGLVDPTLRMARAGLLRSGATPAGGNIGATLDRIQTGLDVAGLAPGAGEFADGANAAISLLRGDFVGAGLSAYSTCKTMLRRSDGTHRTTRSSSLPAVLACWLASMLFFRRRLWPAFATFRGHFQAVVRHIRYLSS